MSRIIFGVITLALLILTLFLFPPVITGGDLGLCLPSPNQWAMPRFVSWLINSVLIFMSASLLASANKKYNFISQTESVMPVSLLIILSCNCLLSATLTTSTLLLICNVLALFILISTYEERNATREFFILATLCSIGSMFQYAFLFMIPVYIGGGLLMKSFRIREFIAFVFGLIAPYWIAVGMGMISPFSFQLPERLTIVSKGAVANDIFLTLVAGGILALMGFILSLYNGVRLFSRNSRLRCMHLAFNVMGYVSILAIIFDFSNFTAYFGTLSLWVAVELAAMLHLYNIRHPERALDILFVIFLPLYIMAIW